MALAIGGAKAVIVILMHGVCVAILTHGVCVVILTDGVSAKYYLCLMLHWQCRCFATSTRYVVALVYCL